jgi:hypothetical protein
LTLDGATQVIHIEATCEGLSARETFLRLDFDSSHAERYATNSQQTCFLPITKEEVVDKAEWHLRCYAFVELNATAPHTLASLL